ncbi:hypothetical protein ACDF64_05085 [Agromyces sp. MMS24-JH15]|uniref:hypothetical protein n=1 Tax=Agromyces sp. MMS24-JH15 TaxID=3243765 RepID=UPI00374A861D
MPRPWGRIRAVHPEPSAEPVPTSRRSRPDRRTVRILLAVGGAAIVGGLVAVPVALASIDRHDAARARELAVETAAEAAAAESLAAAKGDAADVNARLAGFSASLGAVVSPDAAAAFEAARVNLALAIASGDRGELTAAVDAVADALDALAESADGQADALIAASPLADATASAALITAIADLRAADDVVAALDRLKALRDAVVASHAAGQAAADAAAAAEQRARAEAEGGWSGRDAGGGAGAGNASPGWPAPEPAVWLSPGPSPNCGEFPTGQVVELVMSWTAREGNTVDMSYALTDSPVQATSGFIPIVSGGGPSGSVAIPRTCPVGPGPLPYLTVRAVASIGGVTTTFPYMYWGL